VATFVPANPPPAAIISIVALSHGVRLSANGRSEVTARNAATPRTAKPPRVGLAVRRRVPGHEADAGDDREHAREAERADGLVEDARADREKQQEPDREQRLHDDERCQRERQHLRPDADGVEHQTEEPARPAQELPEQGKAQVVRPRRLTRLEGLQREPEVEHRGREERGGRAEEEHSSFLPRLTRTTGGR